MDQGAMMPGCGEGSVNAGISKALARLSEWWHWWWKPRSRLHPTGKAAMFRLLA